MYLPSQSSWYFLKLIVKFSSDDSSVVHCPFFMFKNSFFLPGDWQGVRGGTNEKCLHTGNFFKIVSVL